MAWRGEQNWETAAVRWRRRSGAEDGGDGMGVSGGLARFFGAEWSGQGE